MIMTIDQRPESDLQATATLGAQAAQVLDNPAFAEAFRLMSESIASAWRGCDMRDIEGQQLLLQQMKLVERVRAVLAGLVERGKLAAAKSVPHAEMKQDIGATGAAKRMLRKVF